MKETREKKTESKWRGEEEKKKRGKSRTSDGGEETTEIKPDYFSSYRVL